MRPGGRFSALAANPMRANGDLSCGNPGVQSMGSCLPREKKRWPVNKYAQEDTCPEEFFQSPR
jgi:hypothetical protein